jgi:translation initiation factor IF-2
MKLTPEMLERIQKMAQAGKRADIKEIQKTGQVSPLPPTGPTRPGGRQQGGRPAPVIDEPLDGPDDEDKKSGKRPGEMIGRDARHKARQDKGRQRSQSTDRASVVISGGQVDVIDERFGSRKGPRAAQIAKLRRKQAAIVKKEGPVEIVPPITVRSLSEAIGMKAGELSKRLLKETGKLYAINSPVEFDVAELIAIEKGITLILKQQQTAEDRLLEEYKKRAEEVDPALLEPRPPVVTIMGHVDHGKTSLLDKIRQSNIVDTETGGITQVIRAWSVTHGDKKITFLDTPGHEAFTKMRARGANVTDIVVIVVAATDGVMPQTEEAINHAKAADVDIIIAINKVDMPNANVDKTRRQLYSLGLLPDNMGGDIPFVETSAVTGQGIDELLQTILLVAELREDLKADPTHPASGTCLEAYLQGQEGVMATLLIQQGTLHKGDVVLCGSTYGRVRAMYDDLGRAITEAGPSTPVRITGLDDVPDADDPFYVVEEIATAREIAEKRKALRQREALASFAPVSLETLSAAKAKQKITELKVILKAEARGSVEAIRKELEKLVHDEVRTRVLHAGIGAITESDVQLALTSPTDTLVIGFNVTADDAALKLAEERGINIREYQIIYNLVDDVKAALEGRLKPVEEVVHLGRAVVRETFKISKVGTIAGCYVTSGIIERSARVRVIRQGVVIFPQGDRVVGLESLKRFKEDVKEVREGFECGMKIAGFDDVKVDDVIEAYKIEVRQRTL